MRRYLFIISLLFSSVVFSQDTTICYVIQTSKIQPPVVGPVDIEAKFPGVAIETYGANPFYRKFLGNLTITPLVGENKSLVTIVGEGSFNSAYVGKEFVCFRNHKNPATFPTDGIVNGNYWPNLISCRYSVVTDYVSEKSVKVNFVYNGKQTAPRTTYNQSGYFFYDNKTAIHNALNNTNTDTLFKFKKDSTYVIKGGWDDTVRKHIRMYCPTGKSGIKISIEDFFNIDSTGDNVASITNSYSSFRATFGSLNFFTLLNQTSWNVAIENIDILGPHYMVKGTELTKFATSIFNQPSLLGTTTATWIDGHRSIVNSNTQRETGEVADGSFLAPYLFASGDGGTLNSGGTDIEKYQYFTAQNINWLASESFGLRVTNRAGNYMTIKGLSYARPSYLLTSDKASQESYPVSVKFLADGSGRTRIVRLDSTASTYQWANQYTMGSQGHHMEPFSGNRRSCYIDVKDRNGIVWKLYMAQAGSFFEEETTGTNAEKYRKSTPIISGSDWRLNEQIPVGPSNQYYPQTTIAIDGTVNKKINDTTFSIENWGLQADSTYPFLITAYDNSANSQEGRYRTPAGGDVLKYAGNTYRIKVRKRYGRLGTTVSSFKKAYWVITISAPITASNPTFTVDTSRTEFLLNQDFAPAICNVYVLGNISGGTGRIDNYITYGSKNLNYDLENVIMTDGYWRATETTNVAGTGIATPKYYLPRIKRLVGVQMTSGYYSEIFGGKGLYYRGLIEGNAMMYPMIISGGNITYPARASDDDYIQTTP